MSEIWSQRLGFWWIAEDHPNKTAIAESPDGTYTYGELAGLAHQTVHYLRSLGVKKGDAVAGMFANGVDIISLSLACNEAGLWFIPLNTFLTADEIKLIMEHSEAKAVVFHPQFVSSMEKLDAGVPPNVLCAGELNGYVNYHAERAKFPTTLPEERETGSLFPYTSGTTGKPKGIRRRSEGGDPGAAANAAAVFGRAFDFQPFAGPNLVSTAMYHGGSHSYYMGALNCGHPLVIMPKFEAEKSLQLIDKHKVYSAYMVPTQFHRLLQLDKSIRDKYDYSSLHSVCHSAAPCPLEVKKQMFAWWGPVIWETYGGMEGAATIAKPYQWEKYPGTVGRAIRGVTIKILDDDGNELPPNTIGNIYIGTDGPSFEYKDDEEQTKSAYRGKLFTIGDVGEMNEEGFLFIRDRAKDMIITGGVNVYPQEVEAALLTHPKIADVAVIGLPDQEWGESIKAVVQLKPEASASDQLAEEIIAFCKQLLASYKCPRSVDFRDSLPRTDAGKLYKRQLRDEYAAKK